MRTPQPKPDVKQHPKPPTEQHPSSSKPERHVDKAVEDTFPASDPPSIGGVTKIRQPAGAKPAEHHKDESRNRGKNTH